MQIRQHRNTYILETQHTGYAFTVSESGALLHSYWGKRLPYAEDYPVGVELPAWASFSSGSDRVAEEYPTYSGAKYIEPCLKTTFADGVRDTVLKFEKADIVKQGHTLSLLVGLRDAYYPLHVTLTYVVYDFSDLIHRWAVIRNAGDTPITLERAFSAQWHMPPGDNYRLTHLSGRWMSEFQLRREPLLQGVKVLDSRRITTSHHHNPFFAVDRGNADEDYGEVWFGALEWSGNWKIAAEVTDFYSTRVNIGLNDWDFAYVLQPESGFRTPTAVAGYTTEGFGGASRKLHDFIRPRLPHAKQTRKVLYNSWEATTFNVDVPSQIALAEKAAEMGVELFVMDDGWFQGRDSDNAGLGDWFPDKRKFPNGLQPLIAHVNELGMDFGLWIEPEMVNPNSDLYRAHPEWAIHFPTRESTQMRSQLILNMARTDVQDYLIDSLDKLLSENNIAFIKWDMNRNVSEPGFADYGRFGAGDERELWVRYVEGLYRVWGALCEKHPNVIWQSCSGGGGRADMGILQLADQIWVSDNTEAAMRLKIQEGFSYVFPANTMEAWVTDMNPLKLALDFRFHVSMCGVLGIGGHLLHWTEAEHQTAARWIAHYKQIRHIIQFGDLYRLRSPSESAFSAVQYMSQDKSEGVLFVFRTHIPEPAHLPLLNLRGLEPEARYSIEGVSTRSGAAWMYGGLDILLDNFQSRVLRIKLA
jgi:alpha-galactosidase